jgi:hypothetical protein
VSSSNVSDYINEVLQESENDGDGTRAASKEDWDSAITFTAKASRKCSCIALQTSHIFLSFMPPVTVQLLWDGS